MYQLTLFIIFTIIYVVQSAPLSHDQRIRRQSNNTTNTNNMESIKENFYCAAKIFRDKSLNLKSDTSIIFNSTDIDSRTIKVLRQLFNHL